MKYIRTKLGIFDLEEDSKERIFALHSYDEFNEKKFQDLIIAQADTIEELCDEFVRIDTIFNVFLLADYDEIIEEIYKFGEFYEGRFIYCGAVWTDKGLIYVAKMNEKGCLELCK